MSKTDDEKPKFKADPPKAAEILCDLPGCGMIAVSSDGGLNQCQRHPSWVQEQPRTAATIRAQRGK